MPRHRLTRLTIAAITVLAVSTSLPSQPAQGEGPGGLITITLPASGAPTFTDWGYDTKQNVRRELTPEQAWRLYGELGFTTVRVPILKGAHPGSGDVTGAFYTDSVNAIQRARAVNPNAKAYGSLDLVAGGNSFPTWVKAKGQATGQVNTAKYARLVFDYLRHMRDRAAHITHVGVDNERYINEGNLTPPRYKAVVNEVKRLLSTSTVPEPKFVGPDNYFPDHGWLSGLKADGWGTINIAGTHYYNDKRSDQKPKLNAFADVVAGEKTMWDTEFHWNDLAGVGAYGAAREAMLSAFDNFDRDFSGITWWAFNTLCAPGAPDAGWCTRDAKAKMQTALVTSTAGAKTGPSPQDGDGTNSDSGTRVTRVFTKNGDLYLWVVNDTAVSNASNPIFINGRTMTSSTAAPILKVWQRDGSGNMTYQETTGTIDVGSNVARFPSTPYSIILVQLPGLG